MIDADALIAELNAINAPYSADINNAITNAPTIDPVKHGRWVYDGPSIEVMYKCSECGYVEFGYDHPAYCPNCGARMDGDDNETD